MLSVMTSTTLAFHHSQDARKEKGVIAIEAEGVMEVFLNKNPISVVPE